eukprot:TRINITY_DN4756_c0_g1_i1.p1 TRINITY_DN4756_c0_g1~~TRINITY_DN4756_c0_g1_i1.p1  ORF type:complete len:334 (-),score=62.53 TRINITY_DN4756_c0_g1_i1:662-1663(-)
MYDDTLQRIDLKKLTFVCCRFLAGGSELYGVEAWHYYARNLFLNFNIAFVFAVLSPFVLVAISWRQRSVLTRVMWLLSPFYLWLAFMTIQPHKEERFLYVVYPILCLAAGLAVSTIWTWSENLVSVTSTRKRAVISFVFAMVAVVYGALSLMRIFALLLNYSGSAHVWFHLAQHEFPKYDALSRKQVNVCVGKEWHRFPTSFVFPDERFKLQFLKSGFTGQLPQPFARHNGTKVILPHFNDMNLEEPTRYVDESACTYIVDMEEPGQSESHFSHLNSTWHKVYRFPFVDIQRTSSLNRAFFIPFYSSTRTVYLEYAAFKRIESAEPPPDHENE